MLSKNNAQEVIRRQSRTVPHYGLRKLSIGVASVLLSTTLYAGMSAQADTLNQPTNATTTAVTQAPSSSASGNSSTDAPVSVQAQPSANLQSNAVNQPSASTATPVLSSAPSSENTPTVSATQPQASVDKQVNPVSSSTSNPVVPSSQNQMGGVANPAGKQDVSAHNSSSTLNSSLVRPRLNLAVQPKGMANSANLTSDPFSGGGVIDNWGSQNDPNPHKASPIDLSQWNKGLPSNEKVISKANIDGQSVDISQIFNVSYANTLPYGTPGKIQTSGRVAWNSIINGKTYSDNNGSAIGSSSTTDISGFGYGVPQYYWRTNGSGNPQVAVVYDLKTLIESSHPDEKFDDSIYGRMLTEVYNVTSDGSIEHLFYITNKATRTDVDAAYDKFPNADKYHFYRDFLTLQLELFGDKNLPVFSDGNGGAVISKNGYTVFAQPMFGVTMASHKAIDNNPRNPPKYTVLDKLTAGTKTLDGSVPAAVDYIFKKSQVNPGDTYVYGFKETVIPSFDAQKQGIIKVSYTDTHGNELAKGKSDVLALGSKYSTEALEIPGYVLTDVPSNASGTVQFGISEIKYIYDKGYKATLRYVDDEASGTQVGTTQTLKGTAGSKVATNIKAPTNYVLSGTYPTEYTFTDAANQQLVVHLKHAKQSVNDQKQVTRTVNYTDPTTKQTKAVTTQTVTLQRTGTKDLVTSETKWNNWNTAQWANVTAPKVTGYRVTNPDAAAAMTVNSETNSTTVTFTYVSDHQDSSIVYVDDDKGGAQVKTVPLGGNTGETVKTNIVAPSGYVLNGTYPSEYTFKQSGNTAITVHLKHGKQNVNDQKTVTRTVNYTDPKTNQTKLVERQTATLNRTGTKDLVTNNTAWNAWSTSQLKAVSAPSVAGYQVTNGNAASALTVTDQSKDTTVTFTYTASAQTTHVKYVDKDNSSNVIHTTNVSGKTDQTVSVPIEVPTGWQLVSGQSVPKNVTFTATGYPDTTVKIEHKHTTVTPDQPKTTNDKLPDNPTKNYPAGVGQNDLNKTITRTIQVTDPHTQKVATTTQPVHLTRTADVDEVSGAVTYGKWTTGEWPVFNTPNVPGYTPTQANVAKTTVTDTTKDQTVKITYNANAQTTHVKYVDKDNPSNVIHTTNISGKTDQTVSIPSEVPTGWQLVSGQSVPKNVTFTATGYPDTTVKIEHKHTTVTPDHPKTTNDKLPDNPTKNYPAGVGQNDLNKTITRTIQVVDPDTKKTTSTTQTAHLTRTADVDEVSGTVTYDKWMTGQWVAFVPPVVTGYTPNVKEVPAITVADTTKDQTVTITYAPSQQSMRIIFVDHNHPDNVIKTQTITGKTNQMVPVPNGIPAGWVLTPGQKVPEHISFSPQGHDDVVAEIQHGHVTVTPDAPKTTADKLPDNPTKSYPAGVANDDLNKTLTRTINVTDPHTKKVATTTQKVHLTRTAIVDEVDGTVTYGKWTTGEWSAFDTPVVAGYTPSQANVDKVAVNDATKDQTINITYTANDHSALINYVDPTGKVVHSTKVNGKTDQTVKVPSEVPAGWKLVDGQTVPGELAFGPDGHANVTVKIEHQHLIINPENPVDNPAGVTKNDLNKTIARTINVRPPHGDVKTIKQTVHLTRTADVDVVTKQVVYSKWTTGTWESYTAPQEAGYTPTLSKVNAVAVTDQTKPATVDISYVANPQKTQINYVDDDNQQKLVTTVVLAGKTDQTVPTNIVAPANYVLVGNYPVNYTFKTGENVAIVVHLAHQHKATDDSTVVVRVINYVDPADDQTKPLTIQKVTLKRTGDQDLVTKQIKWQKWSEGEFAAYDAPEIIGYTATPVKAGQATVEQGDKTVTVHYQPNAQAAHIKYATTEGQIIYTSTINGHTKETVKVPNDMPKGWKLVSGSNIPDTITFGPTGHADVTVLIEHQHTTIDLDHLSHGLTADDLQKVMTRTIVVTDPAGSAKTTKQTAQLTRTADVDEVTGKVEYSSWQPGTWDEYVVPTIAGYTPTQAKVERQVLTAPGDDVQVNVAYQANTQETQVIIVDPRGNVVKTTPLTGVTDETVPVGVELPAGWELVNPDEVPATITFGPDGHEPVKVPAKHQTLTVDADHAYSDGEPLPGNPAITAHGISKDDLRKVITRTIKINKPDGTVDEVVQHATLDRQATVDLVTGAVVYEPWSTAEWAEFNAPTIDGYTPDQGKIMAQTVRVTTPNQIEVINYRANAKPAQLSPSVETPVKATANPVTTTKSTTQGDAQLPQTGNSDNDLATIGLLAAGSLGLIAVKKKRETE